MTKGTDKLGKHFAPHQVPALLTQLYSFDKKHRGFFSGHFELSDFGGKGTAHEFAGHVDGGLAAVGEEVSAKLVVFAQEGDGSLYGLWLASGKSLERAPVVYLCSEGDADAVVASNLREFLALLRLDLSELGRFYDVKRSADEAHAPAHEAYMRWADERGVPAAPKSAKLLVKAAQKKHPTFKRWLNGLRKKLWGSPKPAPAASQEDVPDSGVLAFELRTELSKLEACLPQLLAALNGRSSEASSKLQIGLAETEKSDFHASGKLSLKLNDGATLRTDWVISTTPKNRRVLIIQPPSKARKHWEVELWLWPYPSADKDALADLKLFDACLADAGKVLKRRGNALAALAAT